MIPSATLEELEPAAELRGIEDEDQPLPFAVWLHDDIIGAGRTALQAIGAAAATLDRWAEAPVAWRDFSKEDWYGFAGAVRFADGSEPRIAEVTVDGAEGIAIHDFAGITIMAYGEGGEELFVIALPEGAKFALRARMLRASILEIPGALDITEGDL